MENTAAIYCRLSKEDEQKKKMEESESILNQRLLLYQYAKEKGWNVVKEYVDEDYSGLDAARPGFIAMLKAAQRGEFQIILCKSQSRFTRDMELVEKYIHTLFPLWGIRFVGVTDAVDTQVKGNKKARQISGLINEWYCEDLSENIRSVFLEKMKQGQYLAPFAPYGYQKSPNNPHKLIPDEEAAKVVQRIFLSYAKGISVREIQKELDAEKILPPTRYKIEKGLSFYHPKLQYKEEYTWSTNTLRQILKNRVYIGDLVQAKQKKVSYKSKKVIQNPQKDWIVVPNCHDAIIEKEVFLLVQERMLQRQKKKRTDC
ncbi:MAG: recombinase family protein [Epulopiscium sp.]|nr:recombinase family protein [Candidatus Epulonipiscium sp.]